MYKIGIYCQCVVVEGDTITIERKYFGLLVSDSMRLGRLRQASTKEQMQSILAEDSDD